METNGAALAPMALSRSSVLPERYAEDTRIDPGEQNSPVKCLNQIRESNTIQYYNLRIFYISSTLMASITCMNLEVDIRN